MKETKKFQAEVKQILDLMIHSLYSHKEIFLRELISNASDALDKLRYESIANSELKSNTSNLHIRLRSDRDKKTLSIEDNGIGMSYDEVLENIGTIAHSGTGRFLEKIKELKDRPELIGQFGVGFYSAFIVAEKVELLTQKAGENEGVKWESTGDGTYTIEKASRPQGHGTSISLHLKSDLEQDFTEEWSIKGIIKKYSDFISFPIKMETIREEQEKDESGKILVGKKKEIKNDETLNSQKALWLRPSSEISKEDYNEFYKHISHDWNDPLEYIHFKAEGINEFSALIYIPSQIPFDFHYREQKWGLQLYVKRVFILDHCEEIIPPYLRFLKGVIDSSDLSLNVSREMLQQDKQVQQIKKALTGKVFGRLKKWLAKDRKEYEKFWKLFGATIKEGIHSDPTNKERLMDLLLFRSTYSDQYTTLLDYVGRMQENQASIFFFSGDRYDELKESPVLEKFKNKNFEVLLMTDPVDEWVAQAIDQFQEKSFVSVLDEKLDIDTAEEKKEQEEKIKQAEDAMGPIIKVFKDELKEELQDAKISTRLVSSPVCLVSSEKAPSARMERIITALGQQGSKIKRILEINPDHKVIQKMNTLDTDDQKNWAKVLYSQALLQEGSPIENPVEFSKELGRMMHRIN